MPTIPSIRLPKGRIEGANEVAEVLALQTFNALLLGTVEDPGMLLSIPEQ